MSRQYDGAYTVGDLDSMGGDEIRAMTTWGLRAMRAEALRDARRALARLERATDYLAIRAERPGLEAKEQANTGRIEKAVVLVDEVTE